MQFATRFAETILRKTADLGVLNAVRIRRAWWTTYLFSWSVISDIITNSNADKTVEPPPKKACNEENKTVRN